MILAVLQARFSSSRLPGKVLKLINSKAMLELQVERVMRSRLIDKLIIATSNEEDDDAIEFLCKHKGFHCFRGDLNNVLSRFYHAAKTERPDHVVRLTGDCPLIDPGIIDKVIQYHLDKNVDYTSNAINSTFPDGLDVEVMKFDALETAYQNATLPSHLEHVTPYIHQNPACFNLGSYQNDIDLSGLRWTVDEPEDFELVNWVYSKLYSTKPDFTYLDVLALLKKHPEKQLINSQLQRNEGMIKSLQADQQFLKEKQSE